MRMQTLKLDLWKNDCSTGFVDSKTETKGGWSATMKFVANVVQ